MAAAHAAQGGYLERPKPSGLADVIEVILDKGLVIDAYVLAREAADQDAALDEIFRMIEAAWAVTCPAPRS